MNRNIAGPPGQRSSSSTATPAAVRSAWAAAGVAVDEEAAGEGDDSANGEHRDGDALAGAHTRGGNGEGVGLRGLGGEPDAGLHSGPDPVPLGEQRDGGGGPGRGHFQPAAEVRDLHVPADLQAQGGGEELQRPLLVFHRDTHGRNASQLGHVVSLHRSFQGRRPSRGELIAQAKLRRVGPAARVTVAACSTA